MARTVEQIKAQIDEQLATKASLSNIITNPSSASIWKDFRHAISVCIGVLEQLMDSHKSDIETIIDNNIVGTYAWLRTKLFEFQYDASNPQVIELVDLVPKYPVVDESLRILSVVVVRYQVYSSPKLILAKSNPPVKLTNAEKSAVNSYLKDGGSSSSYGVGIGMAGVYYDVYTYDPDYLYIKAECDFNPAYSDTIQASVESALLNYCYNLNDKGEIHVNEVINVVKSIEGVYDFKIEDMSIRPNATPFGSGTPLVTAFEVVDFKLETTAGYMYEETNSGNTWGDKITYTPI